MSRRRVGAAAKACAGHKLKAFRACMKKRLKGAHPAVRRKKRRR
jgi:hypothetical protein